MLDDIWLKWEIGLLFPDAKITGHRRLEKAGQQTDDSGPAPLPLIQSVSVSQVGLQVVERIQGVFLPLYPSPHLIVLVHRGAQGLLPASIPGGANHSKVAG